MRIQKFCTWLVVALFIGGIFAVNIGTFVTEHQKLIESVTKNSITDQYMPDDPTLSERIQARFLSFENTANSSLLGREAGLALNLRAEQALGKRIMQFGSNRMVRLHTGHLYDLMDEVDLTPQVDELIAMRDAYVTDVPMLFVYAQSTLYDETMLDEDLLALDHNMETADFILNRLRDAGIRCIDSREALPAAGVTIDEAILRTDQHWSSRAALAMARETAHALADAGLPLEAENLAPERFESTVFEKNFLGKYGQRISEANIEPDDMTVFWPEYDTDIHVTTMRKSSLFRDETGTFKDAVIRWDQFENDQNHDYSTNSYKAYGLSESEQHFVNAMVPEGRILVIKDSFGASASSFLSLAAHEVLAIDLRNTVKTVPEYIEEFRPDAVVIIFSQQMLRDYDYRIME